MGDVDLHRHLDGSLRLSTAKALASDLGRTLPDPFRFPPGGDLDAALGLFSHSIALLQTRSALSRVAAEICEDATLDGVAHLELRFAPQLHTGAMALVEVVDAVADGVNGRAPLILCALYGESPDSVLALARLASEHPAVVGLDLAGGPTPEDRFGLADYAAAFTWARDHGIGRTVHAGEGRPVGEIRDAVTLLHAQRIGHGLTLLDDPRVLDLVLDRGVTLEACPTSNADIGAMPTVEAHPLPAWLAAGVSVTVCTDNTLFSGVSLSEEMLRVGQIPGLPSDWRERCRDAGLRARFG